MIGPLSAIQSSFNINFPWSLAFWSPWRNYFTHSFVCSQHMVSRNIKLAQTPPSQGTKSHFGQVKPRIFISRAQRNSCYVIVVFKQRTSQSAIKMRFHWTNPPQYCKRHKEDFFTSLQGLLIPEWLVFADFISLAPYLFVLECHKCHPREG